MSWTDQRAQFNLRVDQLAQKNVNSMLNTLNNTIASYVHTSGLTQNPTTNPTYESIRTQLKAIKDIRDSYDSLYNDIQTYLNTQAKSNNLPVSLSENAQLQLDLQRLEKINKTLNVDVETAIARDELLRSRETKGNSHHLFLLDRPIRKQMIPYVWVLSILFIGVGLIIIRTSIPNFETSFVSSSHELIHSITEFIMNPIVLMGLLGATILVIIGLSLKVAGII
jgi:hypothetical protein